MKLAKKIKNWTLVMLAWGMIAITTSGCVYANNKSWNDMTSQEQEELRQELEDTRSDLESSFSENSVEDKFSQYILDKVEQALE